MIQTESSIHQSCLTAKELECVREGLRANNAKAQDEARKRGYVRNPRTENLR